jgi:hypothetical protein
MKLRNKTVLITGACGARFSSRSFRSQIAVPQFLVCLSELKA